MAGVHAHAQYYFANNIFGSVSPTANIVKIILFRKFPVLQYYISVLASMSVPYQTKLQYKVKWTETIRGCGNWLPW